MEVQLFNPSSQGIAKYAIPSDNMSCYDLVNSIMAPRIGGEYFDRLTFGAKLVFDDVENVHSNLLKKDRNDVHEMSNSVLQKCEKYLALNPKLAVQFLEKHEFREELITQTLMTTKWAESQIEHDAIFDDLLYIYSNYYPEQLFDQEAKESSLLLTPNAIVAKARLECESNLTGSQIVAAVGAAGMALIIPNLQLTDGVNSSEAEEVILSIRKECASERRQYLEYIEGFVQECHEKVRSGVYDDIDEYVDKAFGFHLKRQLLNLEESIEELTKRSSFKNVFVEKSSDLVGIFGKVISGKYVDAALSFSEILFSRNRDLEKRKETVRKFDGASYAFEVRQRLSTASA